MTQAIAIVTHNDIARDGWINTHGIGLEGSIQATRRELERAFGAPILGGGEKVTCHWQLVLTRGDEASVVATVYDWKRHDAPALDEVCSWHVGGHSRYAAELLHAAFRQSLHAHAGSAA